MDELPKKRLRRLFCVVEINLILWITAFGASFGGKGDVAWADWTPSQHVILIGIAFAAIAQHWAYYSLYRASLTNNSN
jgi:hypothetical protein